MVLAIERFLLGSFFRLLVDVHDVECVETEPVDAVVRLRASLNQQLVCLEKHVLDEPSLEIAFLPEALAYLLDERGGVDVVHEHFGLLAGEANYYLPCEILEHRVHEVVVLGLHHPLALVAVDSVEPEVRYLLEAVGTAQVDSLVRAGDKLGEIALEAVNTRRGHLELAVEEIPLLAAV